MEVLVAGAILGIVLIGMNVAVARCIHALSVSEGYDAAHEIMTEQLTTFGIENATLRQGFREGSVERNGRRFDWRHELLPTDHPRLYKEIIRVGWKQADGPREEVWESYRWNENP